MHRSASVDANRWTEGAREKGQMAHGRDVMEDERKPFKARSNRNHARRRSKTVWRLHGKEPKERERGRHVHFSARRLQSPRRLQQAGEAAFQRFLLLMDR
jgi:hypothetical protein